VDLKVQQELLRHADIRTTMNIYTHAVPAALREANSKVVRLLLPAQVARELNAPLSSLANLQLTVRKEDVGRGGGDRTATLSQAVQCLCHSTSRKLVDGLIQQQRLQ
jgi:hypothetical protein